MSEGYDYDTDGRRLSPCCGWPINDDRAPYCTRCKEPQPHVDQSSPFDRPVPVDRDSGGGKPLPLALEAPYSNDSTSLEAAERITVHLDRLEVKVYDYLRRQGSVGATDQEIEKALGIGGNTVRPRRRALFMKGLVVESGKFRVTSSGRRAIVWQSRQHQTA